MLSKLLLLASKVKDNRVKGRTKYPLPLIIMILVIGVFKGGNGWKDIRFYAHSSVHELEKYYPTLSDDNFPSVDTIARAIKKLDPDDYREVMTSAKQLELNREDFCKDPVGNNSGDNSGLIDDEFVQVSVDGKEIRGATAGSANDHIIIVNAVCEGKVIAEEKVKDAQKKNEVKAFPKIFEKVCERLEPLGKPIVWTTDAMSCQHSIESLIVDHQGKYLLSLKENHRIMFREVESLFSEVDTYKNELTISNFERGPEKGHGRIDDYSSVAIDVREGLGREWITQIGTWRDIRTVVCVTRNSYDIKAGETSVHKRYYISNLDPDAELLLKIRLNHWKVETAHYLLDCSYSEDKCRVKNPNSAQILSTTRKLALAALKCVQNKTNESIAFLIKKICASYGYFSKVIDMLDDMSFFEEVK
jgi:predicted transposase YbfD/YdcC